MQKTDHERSISHVGATVPESLKTGLEKSFRLEKRVVSGGPDGPAVLDRLGYTVNRSRIMKAQRPARR